MTKGGGESVSPCRAKLEFEEVFKEYDNIQIDETRTCARTDDAKQIVVEFRYLSGAGTGMYGFEYNLDNYDDPELVKYGKDVTVDDLLE